MPGWEPSSPDGRLLHRPSGLSFPADLPGLKRGEARAFDESGSNVAVAYSGTTYLLEITVFAYPKDLVPGGSPEQHLRAAVADIKHNHPKAWVERAGKMRLPLSTGEVDGYGAFVIFIDQGIAFGSWVLILPADPYVVKVRASYDRDGTGDNDSRIRDSFMQVETILRAIERQGA